MEQVANPETGKIVNYENSTRTYITSESGDRPPFTKFIDEPVYKEVLSGIVMKCVDIMIFDPETGNVLLGKRDQFPHDGLWIAGGRKRAGETDIETAVRNLKRELKMYNVPVENIEPVGTEYDLVWDTREQSPTINEECEIVTGCHDGAKLMMLPVDEASIELVHNEEFSRFAWYGWEEIIEAPTERFHPALVQMVEDTFERYTSPDYLS